MYAFVCLLEGKVSKIVNCVEDVMINIMAESGGERIVCAWFYWCSWGTKWVGGLKLTPWRLL